MTDIFRTYVTAPKMNLYNRRCMTFYHVAAAICSVAPQPLEEL